MIAMRKRRYFSLRRFKCPECGAVLTATKHTKRTGDGHVKTMWCFTCKAERDFVQVDVDKAK